MAELIYENEYIYGENLEETEHKKKPEMIKEKDYKEASSEE